MANVPVARKSKAHAQRAVQGATSPPARREALSDGVRLLSDAMNAYMEAEEGSGAKKGRRPHSFRRAYSSLVQAVPEEQRLPLLQRMVADLKALVEEETGVEPAPSGLTSARPVNTKDFMASMAIEEQAQRTQDIAAGRLIPGSEMRARLGVSAQALSAALRSHRMFALSGPSGEYYYPAFFAETDKYDRKDLEKVSRALGSLPSGSKWHFFTTEKFSLGGKTPLELLAKGKVEEVIAAAAGFVEE